MVRQSRNPGSLFWLHTLIGVPVGAFVIVWTIGAFVASDAVLLGALGLMLVGAAALVWRLPRLRAMGTAGRWAWTIVGVGIGVGATVAWAYAAFFVLVQIVCGDGEGCGFAGMN
jgi:uncharacterized membrane protein YhaH (DUF805 family)